MRETIDEAPASENRPDTEADALMDNMESTLALVSPIIAQYNGRILQILAASNCQLFDNKEELGSMEVIERRLLAQHNEEIYKIIAESSRQLFDELDSLKGLSRAAQSRRTIRILEATLPNQLAVQQLVDYVCDYFQVHSNDIMGSNRMPAIVLPRHVCMYLLRQDLKLSLPHIARILNRDHTTVLHACKKIKQQQETDPTLKERIETIRANLDLSQPN